MTFEHSALEDLVLVNPSVPLSRGDQHPFVALADVVPGRTYVNHQRTKRYSGGGSRFGDGDTLFARITPSLENGKIAQFVGEPGVSAFGSTEFIVLRAREGIADSAFVAYLALTDDVRKPAEASMYGASGRQRVDVTVLRTLEVPAPSLDEQRRIAAVLSAYDDLIANNTRRIAILEDMARTIYREWFVEFRYPGHETVAPVESELGPIPEGWTVHSLGDTMELAYGKALKADERHGGPVAVFGSSGVVGHHDESLVRGPGIVVGRKGNAGSVHWSAGDFYPIDTTFYVVSDLPLEWVFFTLQDQNFIVGDTAVPGLKRATAYMNSVLVPTRAVAMDFVEVVRPMMHLETILDQQSAALGSMRDLLLPRLVSGEVDVSDLDIDVAVAS